MASINYNGLKIKGLRKVCSDTKCLDFYGPYCEVFYDRSSGVVWTNYQVSINSYTSYDDDDVIRVCNARHPMTMQEIADAVHRAVTYGIA